MDDSDSDTHLLEINLISAQNLKPPTSTPLLLRRRRRLTTYAVAFIDPSTKLRTRIDRLGSENPTWNDKFIFRVTTSFLKSETSAINVQIFSVGIISDSLLGSVRFLISHFIPRGISEFCLSDPEIRVPGLGFPAFGAFQIRRPSGRFQGVLNVGAMVNVRGLDMSGSFRGVSAIGYRDLMGKRSKKLTRTESEESIGCESDSGESAASGMSAGSGSRGSIPSSMVLKELNGRDAVIGGKGCSVGKQRKDQIGGTDDRENNCNVGVGLLLPPSMPRRAFG